MKTAFQTEHSDETERILNNPVLKNELELALADAKKYLAGGTVQMFNFNDTEEITREIQTRTPSHDDGADD